MCFATGDRKFEFLSPKLKVLSSIMDRQVVFDFFRCTDKLENPEKRRRKGKFPVAL